MCGPGVVHTYPEDLISMKHRYNNNSIAIPNWYKRKQNFQKKLKTLQTGFGFLDRPHVTGRKLNEAHTVTNQYS